MTAVLFDDSLDALVAAVVEALGEDALSTGLALRDATGMLSFVCADSAPLDERRIKMTEILKERLGAYARPDRVLLFADDPGAMHLLSDPDRLIIKVDHRFCWLIDRRIVGSGWLAEPAKTVSSPLRIVFASLKGGVGRSTALAVVASDLAARGRNVLVIDLDLEAPGLGELLLPADRMPRFGVLDYLVENGIGGISDSALNDFIGTSPLTTSGGGRVDVVPVLGVRSAECFENILPKLARAMTEDVNDEGVIAPVSEQISVMIDRMSTRESYDAILIDSRAGLAEIAAPAVLGLGAVVLLFGTAQQQTIVGYRALFSGLKLLAMRAVQRGDSADWRLLFKPVYAKASLDPEVGARYAAELYELFADNIYDRASPDDFEASEWNFLADDSEAPHAPLTIPFDPRFVDFDPLRNRDHLAKAFYEQTFRPFLDGLDLAMNDLTQDPERTVL
jgi:hypothetical protein